MSLRLSREQGAFPWGLLVLFVGSGCAALIYEVVWFQLLRFVIGASAISLGILLASFMGGMCLGSLLFHRFCPLRIHPLKVYASLEIGIGIFGILLPFVIPLAAHIYTPWSGYGLLSILLRSLVCVLCLLIPTALMGATLPAISRWMESTRVGMARLGFFYGANIAGAVLGVLLAGFYLLRFFDIYIASSVAVALNFGVGLLGWRLSGRTAFKIEDRDSRQEGAALSETRSYRVLVVIALSGLTALGAQVTWTRLLSLLFGGTVYTFSIILSVFLSGLGIGSVAGARLSKTVKSPAAALGIMQLLLVPAIAFSAFSIMEWLPYLHFLGFEESWQQRSLDDLVRCALAILPGTILWGASFPLALAAHAVGDRDPGKQVGRIYAANTLGAILGALLFSSFTIPTIGSRASQQLLMALAALAAGLMLAFRESPPGSSKGRKPEPPISGLRPALSRGIPILLMTLVATSSLPHLHPGMIGFGRDVTQWEVVEFIHTSEGINASVAVSNEDGYRNFHVAGKVVASNLPQDMRLQRMLGHIPALLHPRPRSVLVVGFGAGVTAGTFALYPEVERIVIVEIEPDVPAASGVYFRAENYDILNDPRTVLIQDDARHFLATTDETFDIVTADPIHPWVKGAAALYTREFFELCKKRLNPAGMLTQWVPFYETSEEAVKSEIRTIFEAFPYATVWNSDEGIVGYDVTILAQQDPLVIDASAVDDRLGRNPAVRKSLNEINLYSALSLLKTFAGNRSQMEDWLLDGQLNLDRNLRLEYLAGEANNTWVESEIYNAMTRNLSYPDGLFRIDPSGERLLRSWFEQVYGRR